MVNQDNGAPREKEPRSADNCRGDKVKPRECVFSGPGENKINPPRNREKEIYTGGRERNSVPSPLAAAATFLRGEGFNSAVHVQNEV